MNIQKNENLVPLICSVQYQFLENVSSLVEGSDIYHRTVTFSAGQDWFDLYHAPSGISFEEPSVQNEGGVLYNQKLSLFFPGDDPSNIESFYNFSARKMIVKFTYNNNQSKLIGSRKNPASGSCDLSLDNASSGWQIIFSCRSIDRAFLLEA